MPSASTVRRYLSCANRPSASLDFAYSVLKEMTVNCTPRSCRIILSEMDQPSVLKVHSPCPCSFVLEASARWHALLAVAHFNGPPSLREPRDPRGTEYLKSFLGRCFEQFPSRKPYVPSDRIADGLLLVSKPLPTCLSNVGVPVNSTEMGFHCAEFLRIAPISPVAPRSKRSVHS